MRKRNVSSAIEKHDGFENDRHLDAMGHAIMMDELAVGKDVDQVDNERGGMLLLLLSPVRERHPRRLEWRKMSRDS